MYTLESPFYAHINKIMREGTPEEVEQYRDTIYFLDHALAKVPKFTGSVFRGIDVQLPNYKVGSKVVWQSFSSSSTDVKVATEFLEGGSGTLFLIESKNGHQISQFSSIPSESECLFQPNSVFQITGEYTPASKKLLQDQLKIDLTNVRIMQLEEM